MKKTLLYISMFILFPSTIFANDCDYIMEDERMEIIIEQMNNKSDDVKKLNIIKTYLQRLCLNTNQMLTIIEVFESTKMKQDFFLYTKDYITDIENYNQIKYLIPN